MPEYNYRCKACDTVMTMNLIMDDRQEPEHGPCPVCEAEPGNVSLVILSAPKLADPLRMNGTLPTGYGELMKRIQQQNPGSKVYDNLSYRVGKEV